ncbi:MAG: MBL fold metallo-hydrolase [Oscillatoriales cyanobacterium]|nr:MAG: MBL fold metallo-hydrolase [Oscillatoriales cyanobacterium]
MPKQPRAVIEDVFAFSPNRKTLGGTAYFIVGKDANILVDTPAWTEENRDFVLDHGGVQCLFVTHRDAIGQAKQIQADLDCLIITQEQEAYLMPDLQLKRFEREIVIGDGVMGLWTPGHTPGSSCLYLNRAGGVLFTGRHVLPNADQAPAPLRTAKTFHWFRQLDSIAALREQFSAETLARICPGGSTGYLRGQLAIEDAYNQLCQLDLAALRSVQALM